MAAPGESLRAVVGDKTAAALADGLGLRTVDDLLRHYPRRYAERGELTDLDSLQVGEHVTVMAQVAGVSKRRMQHRRGSLLQVTVTDGRGVLKLTFFNQVWRERELRVGRRGLFAGKVGVYGRTRQLTHPDYQLVDDADEDGLQGVTDFAGALIPVYPATAGLPTWTVARSVRLVLDTLDEVEDPLPEDLRRRHRLLPLHDALRLVHQPRSHADVARARDRLRWDEAFVLQVALAQRRAAMRALPAVPRRPAPHGLLAAFERRLPFELTAGQRAVGEQVARDLAEEHPMHRLLQGEVGAGKTVVALRAMLAVVDGGGQAALLAPTEVLAQQHHRSITALLGPLAERGLLGGAEQATRVTLLTGSQGAVARRRALLDVASGDAGIVVGTHALLEERVDFAALGLVVVDEQHRFGVEQRDALRAKAAAPPHVLVMTATPIPRTVAMTVFGDLEVSTLTELPRGRSPVGTHVVPAGEKPHFLERVWQRVREEVAAGHQAYVVCPRIGDTAERPEAPADRSTGRQAAGRGDGVGRDGVLDLDDGDADDLFDGEEGDGPDELPRRPPLAVLELASMLTAGPLAGLRVEVLHGRLPPEAKDEVMRRFTTGEVDVLVATTVVEVGVDVANATAMVVMDADRFGVSQLHQLRGRIGRGSAPGLCLLVTEMPPGTSARERLDAVAATRDGFALSRLDLEQRHEGDVLGASQSGRRSSLRMLSVVRDEDVIAAAREDATALVAADPDLHGLPALRAELGRLLEEERAEYLDKG